jgi:hypothetical protein
MKNQKQFYRHIPILLKNELDKLNYRRKDDLYVIIDLIHRKEIYYKSDYQNRYGYTEIPQSQFKEYIASSDNLNNGIQFLVNNNLLMKNDYFIIGSKPKSYKIPVEYLGSTIRVLITDRNINKRIEKKILESRKRKTENLEFAQTEYFETFKVDIEGANKAIYENTIKSIKKLCDELGIKISNNQIEKLIFCKEDHLIYRMMIIQKDNKKELENIMHRFMVYSTRINAINDGYLFFKRNQTNGRLDTNLTSLPSFLRPFLISSEHLVNVDIKNSQPYFLYAILVNKSKVDEVELAKYKKHVLNGTLYEFLSTEYTKITGYFRTREQMKKMIFKIMFSKVTSFENFKSFFKRYFPSIMNYINETNRDRNNSLAIRLQSIESFTILDVIMPLLEKEGIRPYTIHDSFVCNESQSIKVKEILESTLKNLYGDSPSLSIEKLIPVDDYDDVIEDFSDLLDELNSDENSNCNY